MTTDQIIKVCRDSLISVLGDGSSYDVVNASFSKGLVAMAYYQGDITHEHYVTLNAEIETKLKGE